MPAKKAKEEVGKQEVDADEQLRAREAEERSLERQQQHELEERRRNELPPGFTLRSQQVGWKAEQPQARYNGIALQPPHLPGRMWVLFGCSDAASASFLYEFESVSYGWSVKKMKGSVPTTTFSHSWVVYNGYVYTWGGHGARGFEAKLHRMEVESMVWEELPTTGKAPHLTHTASALHNNCMYSFGGKGSDGSVSSALYCLNLDTLHWSEIEVLEEPVYNDAEQELHYLSKDDKWPCIPLPRFAASCVVYNDSLYVYGGHDVIGSAVPSDQLEGRGIVFVLDLESPEPQWEAVRCKGEPPPSKIHAHASLIHRKGLFCIGGYRSPYVHVLALDTMEWRLVPTSNGPITNGGPCPTTGPLKVGEGVQVLLPGKKRFKGLRWESCRVTRVRNDGTYDLTTTPPDKKESVLFLSCIPRNQIRRNEARLLPFPERAYCSVVVVSDTIVVFGGVQLAGHHLMQDTYMLRVTEPRKLIVTA